MRSVRVLILGVGSMSVLTAAHARANASYPALFYRLPGEGRGPAFAGKRSGLRFEFQRDSYSIYSDRGRFTIRFTGARDGARLEGGGAMGRLSRLIGRATIETTPIFQYVACRGVYDGVDVLFRSSEGSPLESEFYIAPGASPDVITLRYDGASELREDGSLKLTAGNWTLIESPPVAYQDMNGRRKFVPVSFVRRQDGSIGFRVGRHDPHHDLVIDPSVTVSTMVGGSMAEAITSVAVGVDGSVYAAGWTESADFPVRAALQPALHSATDAFIIKLDPSMRTIVYATYLGGQGSDSANSIAVDSSGNVYVTGYTSSTDFPTRNALQPALRGRRNAFISKLDVSGANLVYSTYLGGSARDEANGIQVDGLGCVYIAGFTTSLDFPTASAYQARLQGASDAFIAKLAADGRSLVYSSYFGGGNDDQASAIAVRNGEAYVAGFTTSSNFPVTSGAPQSVNPGGQLGVIVKLTAGGALSYASYVGGAANWGTQSLSAIAVDGAGQAVVTGTSASPSYPVVAAYQNSLKGFSNAVVTKINAAGTAFVASTYFGGSNQDSATGVAIDAAGNVCIAGNTIATNFPVVNAIRSTPAGLYDIFAACFDSTLSKVWFSTLWGGSGSDSAGGIAIANGDIVIGGRTMSYDFPLQSPVQPVPSGQNDSVIVRVNVGDVRPRPPVTIAVFRPGGLWFFDSNHDWVLTAADSVFAFGLPGDIPISGDWNGDGRLKMGVYRNGSWFVDWNGNGIWDATDAAHVLSFGLPGDLPIMGDWNGDGRLKIGVYRNGYWFVDWNGNGAWDATDAAHVLAFGLPGDLPVMGDWNGDGRLKIGVFRNGLWYVDWNGNGAWDADDAAHVFSFGLPGDLPVTGDWTGDGRPKIGVFRRGSWYVDWNGNGVWDAQDAAHIIAFGVSTDIPTPGAW